MSTINSTGNLGSVAFDIDVPTSGPAESSTGDGSAAFRDLPGQQPETEPKQQAQPQQQSKQNDNDESSEVQEDDIIEDNESDDESNEELEASEEVEESKPAPKKNKALKVYDEAGKVVTELDPSTVVDVAIDGKKTRISVKDLMSNYSGKVVYERKYQELDVAKKQNLKDRQAWETKMGSFNTRVNEFYKLASAGKPAEAVDNLISMAGLNSKEFFKSLRDTMYKQAYEYFQMPPEERSKLDQKYDMELEQAHLSRERGEFERLQNEHQAKMKWAEIVQQNGMNDEIYSDIESKFLEHGVAKNEITPELIARTHIRGLAYQKSADILKKVDPGLVKNEDALTFVFNTMIENVELSDADLIDIVKEATATKRSKNITKKIKKSSNPPITQKNPTASREVKKKLTRDDLLF